MEVLNASGDGDPALKQVALSALAALAQRPDNRPAILEALSAVSDSYGHRRRWAQVAVELTGPGFWTG